MIELFLTFAKIGIMTFGGGLAMLPMLERELVKSKQWIDHETLMNYYAIGQCTPGIIAVNVATFVGKKQKGFAGAAAATAGIVFPSIVIITLISFFFSHFSEYAVVKHAFAGARVGVCVLILKTLIGLIKENLKGKLNTAIYIAAVLLSVICSASPVVLILAAAIIGIFGSGRNKK